MTVIVPTYNRAGVLPQTLDSLLGQTRPVDQLIVVDDGSTDQTAMVVAAYGEAVQYIRRENGGKPAALNTGLALAEGTYTWIIDDDDIACPDAIERFARALDCEPNCGFSYSQFLMTTPMSLTVGRIGEIRGVSKIPNVAGLGLLLALLEENFLGGARIFVRTDCYRVVGGYDERFLRSEDYEMPVRLARKWPGVQVEGGATYLYREHDGLRGNASDRFGVDENLAKFHLYDSMLFRELLESLSPEELLPPGSDARSAGRQVLLERLLLSVIHRVEDRVALALDDLAVGASNPYNVAERALIARLVDRIPGLWTPPSISLVDLIGARSGSPAIRTLRRALLREVARHRASLPFSLRSTTGAALRALRMFAAVDE